VGNFAVHEEVSARAATGTGRAALAFGVLLCVLCVTAYAATPVITRPQSDLTGRYAFEGRLPPAMKDFGSISLFAADGDPARLSGEVVVNRTASAPVTFKIIPTSVTGDRLTFKTQNIGGVSYAFAGRVSTRKLPEERGGREVIVLEGALTKTRLGRKLGEIKGSFVYEDAGN